MNEEIYVLYLLIQAIFSCFKVKWRPVVGGFALQFFFATLVLKSEVGYNFFHAVGNAFTEFLNYTTFGAEFVFGKNLGDHFFAFKVKIHGCSRIYLELKSF